MASENPTIHERVTQAGGRDLELLDELVQLKDQHQEAKQAEDAVRQSSTLDADIEAATKVRDASITSAQAVFDEASEKVAVPLHRAQQRHNEAIAAATTAHEEANAKALSNFEQTVAATTETHQIAAAEAQATVYRLKQEATAIEGTIGQHRSIIAKALGINLEEIG